MIVWGGLVLLPAEAMHSDSLRRHESVCSDLLHTRFRIVYRKCASCCWPQAHGYYVRKFCSRGSTSSALSAHHATFAAPTALPIFSAEGLPGTHFIPNRSTQLINTTQSVCTCHPLAYVGNDPSIGHVCLLCVGAGWVCPLVWPSDGEIH